MDFKTKFFKKHYVHALEVYPILKESWSSKIYCEIVPTLQVIIRNIKEQR